MTPTKDSQESSDNLLPKKSRLCVPFFCFQKKRRTLVATRQLKKLFLHYVASLNVKSAAHFCIKVPLKQHRHYSLEQQQVLQSLPSSTLSFSVVFQQLPPVIFFLAAAKNRLIESRLFENASDFRVEVFRLWLRQYLTS